jgi:hypothetical protein
VETHRLIAATGGLLFTLGAQPGNPDAKATDALHRLGYSTFGATLCTRLVPREWVCLVASSRDVGRFGWVHFHRADDGSFVVTERRAGQLAP